MIASNERDVVLDPFCGSGTTLVAAKLLKRKFIGIDISYDAINLSKKRLEKPIKSESMLLQKERTSYINHDSLVLDILNQIDAEPVQRNKGIDGFLKINGKMKPVPIRIQRESETIEYSQKQLLRAIAKNNFPFAILYKTTQKTESALFSLLETNNDSFFIFDKIEDLIAFKNDFIST